MNGPQRSQRPCDRPFQLHLQIADSLTERSELHHLVVGAGKLAKRAPDTVRLFDQPKIRRYPDAPIAVELDTDRCWSWR